MHRCTALRVGMKTLKKPSETVREWRVPKLRMIKVYSALLPKHSDSRCYVLAKNTQSRIKPGLATHKLEALSHKKHT